MSVAIHFTHVPSSARGRCAAGPVVRERLIGGEDESTGYRSSVRSVIRARTAPCEKEPRGRLARARACVVAAVAHPAEYTTSREERRDRSDTLAVQVRCRGGSDKERKREGGKEKVEKE